MFHDAWMTPSMASFLSSSTPMSLAGVDPLFHICVSTTSLFNLTLDSTQQGIFGNESQALPRPNKRHSSIVISTLQGLKFVCSRNIHCGCAKKEARRRNCRPCRVNGVGIVL